MINCNNPSHLGSSKILAQAPPARVTVGCAHAGRHLECPQHASDGGERRGLRRCLCRLPRAMQVPVLPPPQALPARARRTAAGPPLPGPAEPVPHSAAEPVPRPSPLLSTQICAQNGFCCNAFCSDSTRTRPLCSSFLHVGLFREGLQPFNFAALFLEQVHNLIQLSFCSLFSTSTFLPWAGSCCIS